MTVIVTLYWIWFWISLGIVGRRLARKLLRGPTRPVPLADADRIDRGRGRDRARGGSTDLVDLAPVALPVPSRSAASGTRASLADALAGVHLPEDLTPLVPLDDLDIDRRLVLATSGRPVDVVGAAMADELIRLGYAIEPNGPADTVARRDDATLTLHVRSIGPAMAKGPADPAYPTAGAGSVVVDVSMR